MGNSCWADSLLVALLAVHDPLFDNGFLYSTPSGEGVGASRDMSEDDIYRAKEALQILLRRYANSIRRDGSFEKIKYFKDVMKYFQSSGNIDMSGGSQQDAGELMLLLIEIFDYKALSQNITSVSYDTKEQLTSKKSEGIMNRKTGALVITEPMLNNKLYTQLSHFFNYTTTEKNIDSNYDEYGDYVSKIYNRESSSIISPYVPIIINRKSMARNFLDKKLTPPKYLKYGNIRIRLKSVVVHRGMKSRTSRKHDSLSSSGHYVCYFMCANEKWYYYSDDKRGVELIGSYKDLLDIDEVSTHNVVMIFST
jgi:hypothetical protein